MRGTELPQLLVQCEVLRGVLHQMQSRSRERNFYSDFPWSRGRGSSVKQAENPSYTYVRASIWGKHDLITPAATLESPLKVFRFRVVALGDQ